VTSGDGKDKYSSDDETKAAVDKLFSLFKKLKRYEDQPEITSSIARYVDFESVEAFLSGNADASSVNTEAIEDFLGIVDGINIRINDTLNKAVSGIRSKPDDSLV